MLGCHVPIATIGVDAGSRYKRYDAVAAAPRAVNCPRTKGPAFCSEVEQIFEKSFAFFLFVMSGIRLLMLIGARLLDR